MVPLSKELQTMNSYIGLEQLYFNFQYLLKTDTNIEQENISIPTLLVQPIIENASRQALP